MAEHAIANESLLRADAMLFVSLRKDRASRVPKITEFRY